MGKLKQAFLKTIGAYMLIETPIARADVCIVFGCQDPVRREALAAHAADLYAQGYFGLIAVTGGVPDEKGKTEAAYMRDVLMKRGVPAEAILSEDTATNTGENVIRTKALLEREKGKGNISSVIAIGQMHASRRFVMTLERHWPEIKKMFTTPNYYGVPREEFFKDPVFRNEVLAEYRKIPLYRDTGFIREIDVDHLADTARQLPPPQKHSPRPPAHKSFGPPKP
ncbi:MAG TPA: YdcF family protein [Alphaproteobacteria bacterium]|nr:YdcF family protein [Alphaproteobacteria bacterium]